MKKLILIPLLISFCACNQQPKTDKATVINTDIPVEHINPTPDQEGRRKQSEDTCKQHNIPIYTDPNALFVTSEAQTRLRSQDSVADRALALCYIGLKSEGLDQKILNQIDSSYHISSKLSPKEKAYATAVKPTQQQKVDANWRYECLHVMLWSLGFIDTLSYPDKPCNVAADNKIIHSMTEAEFKQKAKLRSKKEILDQADLILRLDWACTDARTAGKAAPGELNRDVVTERHYAFNWLISYLNQNWDDVSTDT